MNNCMDILQTKNDITTITNNYIQQITQTKPTFIATANSFQRKCVFSAIEKINETIDTKITCNRKHGWYRPIATRTMCQKHKTGLRGACDCCSDPFCEGPYCDMCSFTTYCKHAVDVGDKMYKTKVVVGINLFHGDMPNPKTKCKQLRT
jgi:hypothetical protein